MFNIIKHSEMVEMVFLKKNTKKLFITGIYGIIYEALKNI